MARTLTIKTQDTTQLEIGMKIYVVRSKLGTYSNTLFQEKCPLCEGKKKVEMKGYEFACPVCTSSYKHNDRTSIKITNYAVQEYIVNRADIKGSSTKADYGKKAWTSEFLLPRVTWYAFASWSNSARDIDTISIDRYALRVNADEMEIGSGESVYPFYSKAEATKFCTILHAKQERELNAFNKEHGTDHKYPYKY